MSFFFLVADHAPLDFNLECILLWSLFFLKFSFFPFFLAVVFFDLVDFYFACVLKASLHGPVDISMDQEDYKTN